MDMAEQTMKSLTGICDVAIPVSWLMMQVS